MINRQRIISFHQKQRIVISEDCKDKAALHQFCHAFDVFRVQLLPLFQKLHSDVAVGFDWCRWEMLFPAKLLVVVQHAVVGEGERLFATVSLERVVVAVSLLAALCREPGVPDDRSRVPGKEELDLVSRLGLFVGDHAAVPDVGNARCVCATDFRSDREVVYQFFQDSVADLTLVVQESKHSTHFTSPHFLLSFH